jgi:hypothetical protein
MGGAAVKQRAQERKSAKKSKKAAPPKASKTKEKSTSKVSKPKRGANQAQKGGTSDADAEMEDLGDVEHTPVPAPVPEPPRRSSRTPKPRTPADCAISISSSLTVGFLNTQLQPHHSFIPKSLFHLFQQAESSAPIPRRDRQQSGLHLRRNSARRRLSNP